MSQLIIDLNDSTQALSEYSEMLKTLIGQRVSQPRGADLLVEEETVVDIGPTPGNPFVTDEEQGETLEQQAPPSPLVTEAKEETGVELDSEGVSWDARIHSESKSKLKDGTFRVRKYTEKLGQTLHLSEEVWPQYVEQVKNERKAAHAGEPLETISTIEPTPATHFDASSAPIRPNTPGYAASAMPPEVSQPVLMQEMGYAASAMPPATEAVNTAPNPAAPELTAEEAFKEWTATDLITALAENPELANTPAYLHFLQQNGLANLGTLIARPDLIHAAALSLGLARV